MDARRGEVYGAVYEGAHLRSPEVVAGFPAWVSSLPSDVAEVISPDFAPFRVSFPAVIPIVEQRSLAAAVARIARARLLAGDAGDPAAIDANYVRRSDAEMNWTDK
jgi:tRNA A37 threonylcarbamoyladenosine modification protein TsaB